MTMYLGSDNQGTLASSLQDFEPTGMQKMDAAVREAWLESYGPTAVDFWRTQVGGAADTDPRITAAEAQDYVKQSGHGLRINITPKDGQYTRNQWRALVDRQREMAAIKDVRERTPWELSSVARGVAMFGAGIVDPINLATAFVPWTRSISALKSVAVTAETGASLAGRTAARAVIGAADAGISTAVIEPFYYGARQVLGDDYTAYDSMANIAFGAAFGGGVHTIGGAVGDLLRRRAQTVPMATEISPEITAAAMDMTPAQRAEVGIAPESARAGMPEIVEPVGRVVDEAPVVAERSGLIAARIVERNDGANLMAESPVGRVGGVVDGQTLRINFAEVDEAFRGQGFDVALYERLINDALDRGLAVTSDSTVEKSAARVYQALEKRGFIVRRTEGGGELPASEDLPDGALFGRDATEPVFVVERGPGYVAPQPSAATTAATLEPETREAALRASVAQAVSGREIDVDAIVGMDPSLRTSTVDDAIARADANFAPEAVQSADFAAAADVQRRVDTAPKWQTLKDAEAADAEAMALLDDTVKAGDEAFKYSRGQADQTQMPEFKRWFGDSKVVDAEGKPLVVYHGTAADISFFDKLALGESTKAQSARRGFFFAASPKVASGYAMLSETRPDLRNAVLRNAAKSEVLPPELKQMLLEASEQFSQQDMQDSVWIDQAGGGVTGANVLPVYLSIKNPMVMDYGGKNYRERKFADVIAEAKSAGHDGVVFRNAEDSAHKEYSEVTDIFVAFEPTQIKSATGNRGTFDPNNPNILYARGLTGQSAVNTLTVSIRTSFGDSTDALLQRGQIQIVATPADIPGGPHPGDVKAATTTDGTVYVVAENVSELEARGIVLHEVGVHVGMQEMLGTQVFSDVLRQLDDAITRGEDWAQAARAAVPADTLPAHVREEQLAYLVQNAPELPLVQRIIAAVRAWAYRTFEAARERMTLTEADFRAMAVSALRHAARRGEPSRMGEALAYGRDVAQTEIKALRMVDVFGNGNKVEYYDDAKGLMYSSTKYPSGLKWTVWDVRPKEDGGNQVVGEFEAHNSLDAAVKSVRGARISAASKARLAKYGGIPNTWSGDAKKLAKALIDAGVGIDRFSSSTQSASKYIYLDDGRKVRMSDHDLPSTYGATDYDFRYGGNVKQFAGRIAAEMAKEGAPVGQVSPAFSRDVTQTETKAFRDWFGDSKVVDAEGKPLVVYHGTGEDGIDVPDIPYGGMYLAFDPSVSEAYASLRGGVQGVVERVYVRAENLFDARSPDADSVLDRVEANYDNKTDYTNPDGGEYMPLRDWVRSGYLFKLGRDVQNEVMESLRAEGYDAVKYTDASPMTGDSESLVIFRPEQIKSATGNRGTFDPTNPDIRYSRGETPDPSTAKNELQPYDDAVSRAKQYASVLRAAADKLDNDAQATAAMRAALPDITAGEITMLLSDLRKQVEGLRGVARSARDAVMAEDNAAAMQFDAMKAADELANNLQMAAVIEKRNAALNINARMKAASFVGQFRKPGLDFEGFRALLVGTERKRVGGRLSVESEQKQFRGAWVGGMIADLEKAGLWRQFISGDFDAAIYNLGRDGAGNENPPPEAVRIAEVVNKYQTDARNTLNRFGAWIRDLQGYITRQTHDMFKIRDAGEQAWVNDTLPHIDMQKMVKLGLISETDPVGSLRMMYDDFAAGTHMKAPTDESDVVAFSGSGRNLARKESASRTLYFKDGIAAYEYNAKYGAGRLSDTVLHGLESAAKSAGLMKVLGTNPEATVTRLFDEYAESLRGDPARRADFLAKRKELENLLKHVDGTANIPGSADAAKILANTRAWVSMAKLGGALISSITDLANYAAEMRFGQDRSLLGGMLDSIGSVVRGRAKGEKKQILSALGVFHESALGAVYSRFDNPDLIGGKMAWGMQQFFKWNGLNWWTESLRDGYALSHSHYLAQNAGKQFDQLPEALRDMLRLYNIDAGKWEILRVAPLQQADGRMYMTPDGLRTVPIEKLEAYITSVGRQVTEASILNLQADLAGALRAMTIDRMHHAVIEPGARTRAFMQRGTQPGTVPGELLRFVGQFKSFPVALTQMALGREVYGRGYDTLGEYLRKGHGDMLGLASFIALSTAMGYAAMSIKDLIRGKNPRPLDNPNTWAAAFIQGGGLGIYGDFLFGKYNRMGSTVTGTLAGPVAGVLDTVADLWTRVRTGDDVAAAAFKAALDNTPFMNLFYTRAVLDYLILYQVQDALNPGFLRRMERRAQTEFGQTYWLPPSQVTR